MGVRGLQSFMETTPNVAYEVNIKDIVEIYRRETGRDVVIVVDGSSCLRHLYGSLDWICGGQIREYVETWKNFISAFINLGVKLVFFFDGPTEPRKRNVWVDRRVRSLGDAYKVFDLLYKGVHPCHIVGDILMLPPATTYLARFAIETSDGCELHTSIKECDEEVAYYAKLHRCFAILGQDSDYAIFDGPQYYLSASHLNVDKMTTINYNRWALARQLRLSPSLLPLLASLVGNDIVRSDDLLNFHKRLCRHRKYGRPSTRDIIYNVSQFIREHTDEFTVFRALPLIAERVFGDKQCASQLHLSVRSYHIDTSEGENPARFDINSVSTNPYQHWEKLKRISQMKVRNGEIDAMVYGVMHGFPYESSTGLEDFRRTEMPPSAAVYLPLRQRIYGIALHEKPGDIENKNVQEWCMQGEGSLAEAATVPVIPSKPDMHPGLMTLWDENDKSEELLNKKWKLLAHSVSEKLDPEILKVVSPQLLCPTLLLYFLCNEVATPFLEPWEVEAFIATAVSLSTYSTKSLAALQLSRVIPRAVQLACIVNRGAAIIKMLMDVCGRPVPASEVSLSHYFDGKLFQTLYQKAQSGSKTIDLCNNQVSLLEAFNMIRSIVLK